MKNNIVLTFLNKILHFIHRINHYVSKISLKLKITRFPYLLANINNKNWFYNCKLKYKIYLLFQVSDLRDEKIAMEEIFLSCTHSQLF